jgi:hypothetical protein
MCDEEVLLLMSYKCKDYTINGKTFNMFYVVYPGESVIGYPPQAVATVYKGENYGKNFDILCVQDLENKIIAAVEEKTLRYLQ